MHSSTGHMTRHPVINILRVDHIIVQHTRDHEGLYSLTKILTRTSQHLHGALAVIVTHNQTPKVPQNINLSFHCSVLAETPKA